MHIKYHKRGLLDLGVSLNLPSVPILSPIVTPLVGGGGGGGGHHHSPSSQAQPAPQPTPPPQPQPAPSPDPTPDPQPNPDPDPAPNDPSPPSSPSPDPGNSGGDSGNGGGSTGGGSTGGGSTGGGSTGGAGAGGTPGDSGSGNSGNNGDGSQNAPQTGDGSTGGGATGGSSDPAAGTTSPDGSSPNPGGVSNVAVSPSVDGSTNGDGGSSGNNNSNGGGGGGHAVTLTSTDESGIAHTITTIPFATPSMQGNGALGGGGADGNGPNTGDGTEQGPTGNNNGASHKKGLSAAGLGVLITFLLLFLAALIIFILRRRHKARRSARLALWAGIRNVRKSTRSSFMDRGDRPDSAGSFEYVSALSQPEAAHVHETHRLSNGSIESSPEMAASGGAQFLTLPPRDPEVVAQQSPISVRPFSPSESWSFPKPPADDAKSVDRMSLYSAAAVSRAGTINAPPVPQIPNPSPVSPFPNPFADPISHNSSSEEGADPFADVTPLPSLHSATSIPNSTSLIVQTVKRPFAPSLPDELAVKRGDLIRLVREFDDGWCQVVLVHDGVPTTEGLIPIACLTDRDGEQPEFMAKKRSSSYSGHGAPSAL